MISGEERHCFSACRLLLLSHHRHHFAHFSAALAQLIAQLGPLPPVGDLPVSDVLEAVRRDKKVINGRLHFVIAIAIGATTTVDDVTEDELRAALIRLGLKGHLSFGAGAV